MKMCAGKTETAEHQAVGEGAVGIWFDRSMNTPAKPAISSSDAGIRPAAPGCALSSAHLAELDVVDQLVAADCERRSWSSRVARRSAGISEAGTPET